MKVLLDTHTFLWFLGGDDTLSKQARTLIENPNNEKFISITSFWEIAIKNSLGKLRLDVPFSTLIFTDTEITKEIIYLPKRLQMNRDSG